MKTIKFSFPDASIVIHDTYEDRYICIHFHQVKYFIMASNSMQNVIESINFFSISDIEFYKHEYQFVKDACEFPSNDIPLAPDQSGCFFSGIAGGEILIIFKDMEARLIESDVINIQ